MVRLAPVTTVSDVCVMRQKLKVVCMAETRNGRPRRFRVEVWMTAEEKGDVAERAAGSGLSLSAYLRAAGLHHKTRATADTGVAKQLVRINGDLGRLGGLLKLWLADKKGEAASPAEVAAALREVRTLQQQMRQALSKLLRR